MNWGGVVGTGRGMTSAPPCIAAGCVGAVELVVVLEDMVSVVRRSPATVCMLWWSVVEAGVAQPVSGCCPTVVYLVEVWPVVVF